MIIKAERVSTTASRRRLADHLFRGVENAAIEIVRGNERDLADLFRDARQHDARYSVRHWIIAPLEPTTHEQMLGVIGLLAREFDFDTSRAVIIEHKKTRATAGVFDKHWHLCVGEVDPISGKVLSTSHDHARHEYVARLAEFDFGHMFQLGAHHRSVLARLRKEGRDAIADALASAGSDNDATPPREGFTHAAHQMLKRSNLDLPKIRASVKAAWVGTSSADDLREALRKLGLSLALGDKAGEWIVEADGRYVGSLRRLAGARKFDVTSRMEAENVSTIERSVHHRPVDPGRHPDATGGCRSPESGSLAPDNASVRSASIDLRNDAADTQRDPGRHFRASDECGSTPHEAGRNEVGAGSERGHERSGLILRKLQILNQQLQSEAKRATELALSSTERQLSHLEAAERSARVQVEQARLTVNAEGEPIRALITQYREDKARAHENSTLTDQILAKLQELERQHRHLRFLPVWLRPRYSAEKSRLLAQLKELKSYAPLLHLKATSSDQKLRMAETRQSKFRAKALERLATEETRSRLILSSIATARKIRSWPIFAFLPPDMLMKCAILIERRYTNILSKSEENSEAYFPKL